jgi:hypothetical protein
LTRTEAFKVNKLPPHKKSYLSLQPAVVCMEQHHITIKPEQKKNFDDAQ